MQKTREKFVAVNMEGNTDINRYKGSEKSSEKTEPNRTKGSEKSSEKTEPNRTKGSEKSSEKTEPNRTKGSEKSSEKTEPNQTKGSEKTRDKIIGEIRENPSVTINQLALALSISDRAVSKHLKKLQEEGLIKRVGSDKGGSWEVLV